MEVQLFKFVQQIPNVWFSGDQTFHGVTSENYTRYQKPKTTALYFHSSEF